MRITHLRLTSFRNYEDQAIVLESGANLLVGSNGQGKSAVLEAAYLLATSKSHRTTRDGDIVRVGSEWARAEAEVDREQRGEVMVEVVLKKGDKKTVKVNRVKRGKIADLVGQLNAVVFSSSDLDMVKGEPSERRRFMNLEISQVSPQYVFAFARYKRVLDQRNTFLRDSRSGNATGPMDMWDEQMSRYGSMLTQRRAGYLQGLAVRASDIYQRLTDSKEELTITYRPSVEIDGAATEDDALRAFADALCDAREADLSRSTTTRGPHRDDVAMQVNGMDLRHFGSQGQQRSVALAVKLAEVRLITELTGETPVLLLDDVGSELDEERRKRVFDIVGSDCQMMVTATSLAELPDGIAASAAVFEVRSGVVSRV